MENNEENRRNRSRRHFGCLDYGGLISNGILNIVFFFLNIATANKIIIFFSWFNNLFGIIIALKLGENFHIGLNIVYFIISIFVLIFNK